MITLALLSILAGQSPLDTRIEAKVSVDIGKAMAKMQPEGLGVGVAVWDAHMVDKEIPALVGDAGFKIIRYPGGSYADIYQWKTATTTKGVPGTVQPHTDFDSFMAMCLTAKNTPLITVNYGSNPEGTGGAEPAYAAEWVRYANKAKRYGVKYWEIGNEVYGNGFYNGQGWEYDLHAPDSKKKEDRLQNPKLGPTAYGENVSAFARAMKAEDPTIKVGAVVTAPGEWPDAVAPDWNSNVLAKCGKNIDFVAVHWYPSGKTAEELYASLRKVPEKVRKLREVVDRFAGPNVQIWMTEGDASGYNQRQPGALFAADHFMTWLSNGTASVNWWNLHNGLSMWEGSFGDQGMLSSGHSRQGITQPPANTPFPPYYGVQMVDRIAKPGDQFIECTSDRKYLISHAVRQKSGRLGVMLINQDADHPIRVSLTTPGFTPATAGDRFEYRPGWTSVRKSKANSTSTIDVPANSIVVVTMTAKR